MIMLATAGLSGRRPTSREVREPGHDEPVVLGRGERLWEGLEGLEQRFDIEATPSPGGVVHLTFVRRRPTD